MALIPIALTIGGSDSGGGAGIQADLKTFSALQVHGCSAISCVTAQNTLGVERVDALPPEALRAQVEAVSRDLPVAALKTGMLLNRGLIEATAASIAPLAAARVIDPVMVSRSGAVLLEPEAIEALKALLLPLADLLTPNVQEARLLGGQPLESAGDLELAAERIAAMGPKAVLIKGAGCGACAAATCCGGTAGSSGFAWRRSQHPTATAAVAPSRRRSQPSWPVGPPWKRRSARPRPSWPVACAMPWRSAAARGRCAIGIRRWGKDRKAKRERGRP